MKFTLLSYKLLYSGRVQWRLALCNLYEYLSNLREDFFDFDVQRRIVSNSYLDKIGDSILNGEPIPAFTLTSGIMDESKRDLNLSETEILDGLQRTYRLWSIIFLERIINKGYHNFDELYNAIKDSQEGQKMIDVKVINRSKVRSLIDNDCAKLKELIKAYKNSDIILNIWSGLSEEQIIQKMLTLNAGQRSVSSTHQFELLFLRCFKALSLSSDIKIFREKNRDYGRVKRGERRLGEYLMTSIVIALQSYIDKEPLRISQVNKLRIEDSVIPESSSSFFNRENLHKFIELISQVDIKTAQDRKLNVWIMKDTTLSGLFAALGVISNSSVDFQETKIQEALNKINSSNINIDEFETSYQKLSSVSTNVGNAVRKAVYNYFRALFENSKISWIDAFNTKRYDSL